MKAMTTITVTRLIMFLALGVASCGKKSPTTASRVNLNMASAQELQKVPGVDKGLAQNIVAFRDSNGPFQSVNDLSRVKGMTPQKLNAIKSHVYVGGQQGGGKAQPQRGEPGQSRDSSHP